MKKVMTPLTETTKMIAGICLCLLIILTLEVSSVRDQLRRRFNPKAAEKADAHLALKVGDAVFSFFSPKKRGGKRD